MLRKLFRSFLVIGLIVAFATPALAVEPTKQILVKVYKDPG